MAKKLVLTQHARDAIGERLIEAEWIERAVRAPDWVEPDPRRGGVGRRFRAIAEHANRVLRVACYETDREIIIVTAFFDRDARRPE